MPAIPYFSAHFQPERPLIDQLEVAFGSADWDQIDVPVAYAVTGGVRLLEERLSADPKWPTMRKRFLIGIDWFRSEPLALDGIAALQKSSLRIVDGAEVVRMAGCRPSRSFHPKAFILTRDWREKGGAIGCLIGSGNLSRNGLTFGREVDVWVEAAAADKTEISSSLAELHAWFEDLWRTSTKYEDIRNVYRTRFEANQKGPSKSTTDDDSVPSAIVRQRGLKPDDLVVIRSFDRLWIDAGSMYSNLGEGRSGNQLEMKRYTRVFFGFPAQDLPKNSPIGGVALVYGTAVHPDRHLRYGDNQMDKLDLPVPGVNAPRDYRHEALLFTRHVDAKWPCQI